MKARIVTAVVALALATTLAACGEDEPAVCSSVDTLRDSVEDLKNIDVTSSGALSELESGLTTIQGDLADVKSDAESEFASQIDAVETGFSAVRTSIEAAKSDPSAATLAAAGTALSSFASTVGTFIDDVRSTC